jgi:hypothetical protein
MTISPEHCQHDIQREYCHLVCLNCGHECREHHPDCQAPDCDCKEFEQDPGR